MDERKNINRGFRKLLVWKDAVDLYVLVSDVLGKLPYELKRTTSNVTIAAHSIGRNIAEGYCRKSLKEYLQFLYYSLGSSGELHSSLYWLLFSGHISKNDFSTFDKLHYKMENEG